MDTSGKISEFDVDRITQLLTRLKVFKCYCHLTRYILDASYDLGKWNLLEPGWFNQVDSYLVGTAITPSPLVIVTTLPLAFLVGNSWTILSVSLSKTSNYYEIIFSIKTAKTWSWGELSGSRESSQRHWCPSLSCMRTIEDITVSMMIQWKSNLFSKVFFTCMCPLKPTPPPRRSPTYNQHTIHITFHNSPHSIAMLKYSVKRVVVWYILDKHSPGIIDNPPQSPLPSFLLDQPAPKI